MNCTVLSRAEIREANGSFYFEQDNLALGVFSALTSVVPSLTNQLMYKKF
jgi:hypothetical protein